MSKKYELSCPSPIKDLVFNWSLPSEVREIPLGELGKYRLPWHCYVIIDLSTQKVKLTHSYKTWLKEVSELYMLKPERTDISAFRVARGFRPKFKASMYVY